VTITGDDGSAETFEFDFGPDTSIEEVDAAVDEVLASLRDRLGEACPRL
jgi:hypothetical protein